MSQNIKSIQYLEQTHGHVRNKMQEAGGENELTLGETKLFAYIRVDINPL